MRERGRRPAQDLLHVMGDKGGFVERLGEHGRIGVSELGGETQTDEPLPHHVGRYFPVLQRATEDGADDVHQL